jgi:hypothetical protein
MQGFHELALVELIIVKLLWALMTFEIGNLKALDFLIFLYSSESELLAGSPIVRSKLIL